ncbi:hypothetical protein BGZ95_000394 [Linnemannia exigua]|uniref:Uncharacterized protein n=1 Tax=Linnemannia exigua TaxID=604196 RepID=A0AAD4DJD5_9FUNG|nr:hypothetical protein BGZ95_000394 [Linnemannia exigua]
MNFNRLIHHRLHRAYLPSYDSRSRSFQQVAWVLRQSPNLIDIDMNNIHLKDVRDIQALPTVIHGLTNLRKLRMHVALPRAEWAFLSSTLFFSCPPSLRHLWIGMFYNGASNNGGDPEQYAITPTPPRRQEPLRELRSFYVQEVLSTSTDEFLSHFQHFPALEVLYIPKVTGTMMNFATIAQFIASHCPNLHSIVQDSYQPGSCTPICLRIAEIIAPQTLQKLHCVQCFESTAHPQDFSNIFRRHSITFRSIELSPCWSIKSTTLRTILCECRALEEFVLIQAEAPNHCGIDLVDAVAAPWACTNMERLFLVVNILDFSESSSPSATTTAVVTTGYGHAEEVDNTDNGDRVGATETEPWRPYYARKTPIVLTAKEEEQFRLLEMFYRQLGALTQLKFLCLKAQLDTDFVEEGEDENEEPWLNYQRNSMPAMLSLGDVKTNRPGFLHLFSKWKKLKSLFGSVALDTAETRRTVGLTDVQFMVAQWPKLNQAEFMQNIEEEEKEEEGDVEKEQSALEWLQEARPDVEIVL